MGGAGWLGRLSQSCAVLVRDCSFSFPETLRNGCWYNFPVSTGNVRVGEYWHYPERGLRSLGWLEGWHIPAASQETSDYRRCWQHPETSALSLGNELLLLSGLGGTGEGTFSAGVSQIHETVNASDIPAWWWSVPGLIMHG